MNYLNNNPMEKDIQDAYKKGFIDGKIEGSKCIFCDYGETAKKEIIERVKCEERNKWRAWYAHKSNKEIETDTYQP